MPSAIDLCIRDEKFGRVMRRDQNPANGDIHVVREGEEVASIEFNELDLPIWQAFLNDLLTREQAHPVNSTIKLVQNGNPGPDLYVNGNKAAEVLFTRSQLLKQVPQVTTSK